VAGRCGRRDVCTPLSHTSHVNSSVKEMASFISCIYSCHNQARRDHSPWKSRSYAVSNFRSALRAVVSNIKRGSSWQARRDSRRDKIKVSPEEARSSEDSNGELSDHVFEESAWDCDWPRGFPLASTSNRLHFASSCEKWIPPPPGPISPLKKRRLVATHDEPIFADPRADIDFDECASLHASSDQQAHFRDDGGEVHLPEHASRVERPDRKRRGPSIPRGNASRHCGRLRGLSANSS